MKWMTTRAFPLEARVFLSVCPQPRRRISWAPAPQILWGPHPTSPALCRLQLATILTGITMDFVLTILYLELCCAPLCLSFLSLYLGDPPGCHTLNLGGTCSWIQAAAPPLLAGELVECGISSVLFRVEQLCMYVFILGCPFLPFG